MGNPKSFARVLLASLLLSGAFPARAHEGGAPDSSPKKDARKTDSLKPAEQIKNACDAEAVEVRLKNQEPGSRRDDADHAPAPASTKEKEAQTAAKRLGSGVEREADEVGQTLSWKRGKTTKSQCRAKLRRLRRDFPGRVSFEPTTEERVAEVQRRRDALIPEMLRRNTSDAAVAGGFFDGGGFLSRLFGMKPRGEVAAGPTALASSPYESIRPTQHAPGYQLPMQYRGALASAPPQPEPYVAPTFGQRVSGAWDDTQAYVSKSLDEAEQWVSGVARTVRNRFYSGIEMIQGYGYKFIHAGRQTNWGTKPLVNGLRKIAAYMRGVGRAETDLAVGDISSVNGGQLYRHASHQKGRDVDIGFYMTDMSGKPVDAPGFVRFSKGRDGRLAGRIGDQSVLFDAQRNWFLVQAILANSDPEFKPTFIFIDTPLEAAILAAAGASPDRARAQALMRYWKGHDNHLHLRVQ